MGPAVRAALLTVKLVGLSSGKFTGSCASARKRARHLRHQAGRSDRYQPCHEHRV